MSEEMITNRGRRGGIQPQRATPMTRYIGAQVRTLRTEQGMSGSRLAAAVERHGVACSRTTIAKLETGRRATVSVDELIAWAAALDVPIARLLPPDYAQPPTPDEALGHAVRLLADVRRTLRAGESPR